MNYDEMVHRKSQIDYERLNPQSNPSYDRVRKREQKILNILLPHGEDGVSHQELANITGIDRNYLRPYLKRLMAKGFVTREKDKHGKYFPTTKARRGKVITASILGESFESQILDKPDFPVDYPCTDSRSPNSSRLESALLNFSITVAGFICYTLIESMNPANKITLGSKNLVEKDLNVQRWIEDTISAVLPQLLSRFKYHIFPHLDFKDNHISNNPSESDMLDMAGKQYFDFLHKRPFFTLDQPIFSEMSKSFSKLYPNLTRQLEKTRSNIPKLLEQEINHMRYISEIAKLQKTCRHKYERPLNKSYDYHQYEHCRKCHKTRQKEN